jgi:Phage tail tube protein
MAGELWRDIVQIGKEVTPGTPVAATRRMYWENVSFTRERNPTPYHFATGSRDNVRAMTLRSIVVGGSAMQYVSSDENLELLMMAITDSPVISTPVGATLARLWTFKPGDLASATIERNDGARIWQTAGVRVNQITIAGNVHEDNQLTAEFFATDHIIGTLTGALAERTPTFVEGWETKVYASAFGTAPAVTNLPGTLLAWNIVLNNNLGRKYFADNTLITGGVVSGQLDITATLTMEAASASTIAEYANWDASTKRSVTLEFGNNVIIEAALKRFLAVDLPGQWSAVNLTGDDNGTRSYELSFQYIYDPTLAAGIQIRAQNSRTAAF